MLSSIGVEIKISCGRKKETIKACDYPKTSNIAVPTVKSVPTKFSRWYYYPTQRSLGLTVVVITNRQV